MPPMDISNYLDDRRDDGVFRVHRKAFSDEALFELEQKHIFERTWSFLGHRRTRSKGAAWRFSERLPPQGRPRLPDRKRQWKIPGVRLSRMGVQHRR